jgi:hypothetical protein
MELKIYDLKRTDMSAGQYDVCNGGIVIAESIAKAREMMSECAWDEGADLWLDPHKSSCKFMDTSKAHVVITDCNPG